MPTVVVTARKMQASRNDRRPPEQVTMNRRNVRLSNGCSTFPRPIVMANNRFHAARDMIVPRGYQARALICTRMVSFVNVHRRVSQIMRREGSHASVKNTNVRPLPGLKFLGVPPVSVIRAYREPRVRIFYRPRRGIGLCLYLGTLMDTFVLIVRHVPMTSTPVRAKREVRVGIVVRPMLIFQGCVASTCARRVRPSDKRVTVRQGDEREGRYVNAINAM